MEPCFDVLYRQIDDGVDVTSIDRPNCHTYFLPTYSERSSELLQQDTFTVLEHDELPLYGTGPVGERVVVSCYEQDSGTVHAVIDTDVPAIRGWAQSVYEHYRSDVGRSNPDSLQSDDLGDDI